MSETSAPRPVTPLRLLFIDPQTQWRPRFEQLQAWLAFDLPVSIGFATPALELLRSRDGQGKRMSAAAFASLRPLGLDFVYAPGLAGTVFDAEELVLPVRYLSPQDWRDWLRDDALVAA